MNTTIATTATATIAALASLDASDVMTECHTHNHHPIRCSLASLNARDAMIELVDDNKDVYRASIRPEVAKFAIEMETVLRKNDHKHGWDEMDLQDLFYRIQNEFEELRHAYGEYALYADGNSQMEENIQHIHHEAIGIANSCMFLCHNYPETEADS